MAVEQEMAVIYPPEAEAFSEFLPETDCGRCGYGSCIEFSEALLDKKISPRACPELDTALADVMVSIIELNMDPIPFNCMMEQVPCELIEINHPIGDAPLLVTSNFRETVRIMKTILESTHTPAFLLPTFTHGYSVDNAVHERMFKAIEIWKAIKENNVEEKIKERALIIPGLAESEKNAIRQISRWDVQVGPVSGFLAPLFIKQIRDRS
jgi:CO dehydrogenase/acetyl-CoA synthase gamma subunit (corrinoid Fe-S protein)